MIHLIVHWTIVGAVLISVKMIIDLLYQDTMFEDLNESQVPDSAGRQASMSGESGPARTLHCQAVSTNQRSVLIRVNQSEISIDLCQPIRDQY